MCEDISRVGKPSDQVEEARSFFWSWRCRNVTANVCQHGNMEREEAHTCTNHPIINNVHGVGGRPQLSEGWGVRWGARDQQFGPGQQLSSLLWASPLLQLASRLLLCAEKTDERRPISLSPAQMVLKQSAACYQLMRREQLLWTIKWKDYVWLYSIWILKKKKRKNTNIIIITVLPFSWKHHISVYHKLSLFFSFSRTNRLQNIFAMLYTLQTDRFFQTVLTRTTESTFFLQYLSFVPLLSAFCSLPAFHCCQTSVWVCKIFLSDEDWASYIIFMFKLIQFPQNSDCGNKRPFV